MNGFVGPEMPLYLLPEQIISIIHAECCEDGPKDLIAEQMCDGSGIPPFFCPNVFLEDLKAPTAIWGDVLVCLPWALYQSYGDQDILSQHMESMTA